MGDRISKTKQIANCTFHYYEKGKGSPILFLHGWLHSGVVWREVTDYFSSDYTTIEVDLPGFGKSSAIDSVDFSLTDYGEYLHHFISEVTHGKQKPIIVADSLSAILCLQILQEQNFRYRHLFLMGCPLDGLPFYISILSRTNSIKLFLPAVRCLPEWITTVFVKHLNFVTLWNRSINAKPLINSAKRADPRSAQNLLALISGPYKPITNNLTENITLIRGNHDRLVQIKTLKKLSSCLNNAPIIEIPHSGHSVMLENPLKLIECISNHLEEK